MSYYRVCPLCGAALDPGERCDCNEYLKPVIAPPCCEANKKPPRALAAPRAARWKRF